MSRKPKRGTGRKNVIILDELRKIVFNLTIRKEIRHVSKVAKIFQLSWQTVKSVREKFVEINSDKTKWKKTRVCQSSWGTHIDLIDVLDNNCSAIYSQIKKTGDTLQNPVEERSDPAVIRKRKCKFNQKWKNGR